MKTARITFLGSDKFKANLEKQTQLQKISVGELIRRQFDAQPSNDELLLAALTGELRVAVRAASEALKDGLAEADSTLSALRSGRESTRPSPSTRANRKVAGVRA